jgi:hypothetical protein
MASDETPKPYAGRLFGRPDTPINSGVYPVIDLIEAEGVPDTYNLRLDFGPYAPPRSAMSLSDLGLPSIITVPVEIRPDEEGTPTLYLPKKARTRGWIKNRFAGWFDYSSPRWRVDAIVLAAGGQDTRAMGNAVTYLNGDRLDARYENLQKHQTGHRMPSALDALASFAALDEVPPIVSPLMPSSVLAHVNAHMGYVRRVVAQLLSRYVNLQLETKVVEAETNERWPVPLYRAEVKLTATQPDGRQGCYRTSAIGLLPEEAVFFAWLDVLRLALFYGYPVAYCGVLARYGPLVATLDPIDIYAKLYKLTVCLESDIGDDERYQHLKALGDAPHEILFELETPKGRAPYLRAVGKMSNEVKCAFEKFLDFKKLPVRLHRLILAMLGYDMRSYKKGRPIGIPALAAFGVVTVDVEDKVHGHHLRSVGLDTRAVSLWALPETLHGLLHAEWAPWPGHARSKATRKITRTVQLASQVIQDVSWVERMGRDLHLTCRAALKPSITSSPRRASTPKPSPASVQLDKQLIALATRKGASRPDKSKLARIRRIVRALAEAGHPMSPLELMTKTSINITSIRKWLTALDCRGVVTYDKGKRGSPAVASLNDIEQLSVLPPKPRRRRHK